MAVKKKKKSVKKKTKTKVLSSKKSVKKKASVKKKIKKKPKKTAKKKTVKKVSQKKPSKKRTKKPVAKKEAKDAPKKIQTTSYLSELEQELERILEKNRQVSIKGSEGFEYCFEENCDQPSTTGGYCRYHYMVSWSYIKRRYKILYESKLKFWMTELVQNYSPRILNYMVRDLSNEKDFSTALSEMKLSPKKPASY